MRFPTSVGRFAAGRWLALGVLAVTNVGLLAVVLSSRAGASAADVIAPLTGHLIGFGIVASLTLLVRARMLTLLALGMGATVALHAGLGWARCCEAPRDMGAVAVARASPDERTPALTVLTLNTWRAYGDVERMERYLATAPADVVVLSEFDAPKQALIERLQAVYPHHVVCPGAEPCPLAMLSRLPFETSGASRIAPDKPAFVWARINFAPQSGSAATTIIGTHLLRPTGNPWRHETQMQELARFVRRIDGPLVLAGSLHTSPWSQSFRTLRTLAGLVPTGPLTPTWPAWPVAMPQVALDHIFVSQDLMVAAAGTGPAVGSDHLPVWARLERPPIAAQRPRPARAGSRLAAARTHLGGEFLGDLGGEHGGARNLSW